MDTYSKTHIIERTPVSPSCCGEVAAGRVQRFATTLVLLAAFPLTSLAQAIDLREVYEKAKTYDAEYQAAQLDLEGALQRVPLARSALLPQLNLGAEGGLDSSSGDGLGTYEATAVSLSLSQTIYNRASGQLLDQAKLGVLQAKAQYAAIGQTLILRTATAYFDVLRAQANVEFSQSELQAISRQREQAERRFDVGLVPITDVRSAQAQYDLAVAQEIAASDQFATAQEALLRVSGVQADLLVPLASDFPLTPPEPANIDTWVETAMDQNLELVVARLVSESSQAQLAIERAGRYPTLDIVGTARTTTGERIVNGLPGQLDNDSTQLRLQLQLPLLSGGRVSAQIAQAKAQSLSAEQQLITQERTTTQQTRDGYRGVRTSIARVRALRQALASTQKSAEATEAGFRAGTRTSVEVLQELRDTFRAQSDYAGARYDYIINMLNLKAASGTLSEEDIYGINRFLAFSN